MRTSSLSVRPLSFFTSLPLHIASADIVYKGPSNPTECTSTPSGVLLKRKG